MSLAGVRTIVIAGGLLVSVATAVNAQDAKDAQKQLSAPADNGIDYAIKSEPGDVPK